jgi:hypothetical protein
VGGPYHTTCFCSQTKIEDARQRRTETYVNFTMSYSQKLQ